MSKNMLIDAAHAEETRVVVLDGHRVEEFDFESRGRKQLRGNIYLAKVTRVEPSLQAAFIEYGGNRHGFLAFNEIHPDYYQIPVADREAIMAAPVDEDDLADVGEDDEDDEVPAEEARLRRRLMRKYKIQEVIKRRQILLIQVVKEERGNKGAALTTYLSLAGRYCVLMPNTARGGGISRKITTATDRKRLKTIATSLDVPQGMGLIVRTAGAKRTKQEIKRDYEYLLRMWENIRENTLKSIAPALIYEEEDLVKRAIRDMFDKDIDNVFVEGEEGYREAREFMRMLMPSQAKKVQFYREPTPLFIAHKVEDTLQQIHSPTVPLKSGGYLVINQTEALVAIDVNSGRATKERNIEATALKTNMEAAQEAGRQMRLRDLAGLIVIDFIDMDEAKNNRAVEKVLKDSLAEDRARIQMGKISGFGLMEISRQRRRTGLLEGTTHVCEHCQGSGRLRAVESSALLALRAIEMEAVNGGAGSVILKAPMAVALYILNEKRAFLSRLDEDQGLSVNVVVDDSLARAEHLIERTEVIELSPERLQAQAAARNRVSYIEPIVEDVIDEAEEFDEDEIEDEESEGGPAEAVAAPAARERERDAGGEREAESGRDGGRRRRRRRRGGGRGEGLEARSGDSAPESEAEGDEEDGPVAGDADESSEEARQRRRRRGRRGGRRMRDEGRPRDPYVWVRARTPSLDQPYVWFDPIETALGPTPTPRPEAVAAPAPARGPAPERTPVVERAPVALAVEPDPTAEVSIALEPVKRRRVRSRRPAAEGAAEAAAETAVVAEAAAPEPIATEPVAEPEAAPVTLAIPEPAAEPVVTAEPEALAAIAVAPIAPETVPPAPEPVVDPAEIVTPPVQPKRGWWRRRG
jgi:ribonuclease E